MNYLCLLLPLFGIFASKSLEHSPLCPCDLECKPTQKLSKIKSRLIYRTHLLKCGFWHAMSRDQLLNDAEC